MQDKKIRVIETSKHNLNKFIEKPSVGFCKDINEVEMKLLMIYSDIKYQQIKGFGGAFTEASAYNFYQMNLEKRQEILEAYFAPSGLNYSVGRTHIGSCDFSFGNYNYAPTEDLSLSNFSIECDKELLIPLIKDCQSYANKKLTLMGSPWSPPAWMKTNAHVLRGGKLKPECYQVFADYLIKYIQAYQAQGITLDLISLQNEPKAVQKWESCIYTAEEEQQFIRDHLYPSLVKANLTAVKIVIWDHNKERAFERARLILADPLVYQAVYGIGVHWYSGDHFENLRLCKEFFPDKELVFTEGCVELSAGAPTNAGGNELVEVSQSPWEFGEKYAYDIIGNINAGLSTYIDWNLLLDVQGGPNHVSNFCSAPIICDYQHQQIIYQPSYYFIGHLSKYVAVGSYRVAHSSFTNKLNVSSFITPSNEVVVVILNSSEDDIALNLKDVLSDQIAQLVISQKSITTLIYPQ